MENIDTRIYNLSSFRIEDDNSSTGSTCQDQNSIQKFESSENDNCIITSNEWEDQSENEQMLLQISIVTILQQVILQLYAFWKMGQIYLCFIPLTFQT